MTKTQPPPEPLLADGGALLLGNEAIVRGALEAGVAFACGYPGTPSSEVTDSFARLAKTLPLEFEYSVNEKVALEIAFAASLAGARSIVAMKHLGLTYSGDPLTTIPYVGTVAGMVIVSAGDPSCRTSPNEQDQRHLADMLHIPMLDPSTPQEALEMTRFAFDLSEKSSLPVIVRPTTRLAHTRALVRYGDLRSPEVTGFRRDPRRFVPIPANARRLRIEIKQRIEIARTLVSESGFVRHSGGGRVAVLASGVPAATCADLLEAMGAEEQVVLLSIGAVHPLPTDWLLARLREVDTVVVVEELSPYLEDAVRALCSLHGLTTRILGKRTGHFPEEFEYLPGVIQSGLHGALGLGEQPSPPREVEAPPARPPILCAACPHRSAFFAARAATAGEDVLFFNDIGCYTLGYGPPLDSADAVLGMGAGFTLAAGVSRATGRRTVGFMGDGTFFHSGMPALLDAIKEDVNMVAVILDNQVTAMTGFQESATVEVNAGTVQRRVDIAAVVAALGARHVERVDPNDLAATVAAFRNAYDRSGLSVIITERPCPVFLQRVGGLSFTDQTGVFTYVIDRIRCQQCGREECGQRCAQDVTVPFERAMARARSLESGGETASAHPEVAPCATKCPLFLCIQGYAAHIAARQYGDALELIMSRLPLPDSVCRVCHRPCEEVCVRGSLDEPVAINDLKRFVMDWASAQEEPPFRALCEPDNDLRVGIVGAGPSGLAAAHDLRSRGYQVKLFDADGRPGGLLRSGIPRYRLPSEALERDVQRILGMGVEFAGGRRLGDDLRLRDLVQELDAVYLATGASRPITLDLAGPGDPPVVTGLEYLRTDSDGDGEAGAEGPRNVVVLGGGNAAVDAARTALRRGASRVVIACIENRAEMPAIASEVSAAQREGVEIRFRHKATTRTRGGIELASVTPREPGNLHPDNFVPIEGHDHFQVADLVIAAVGQSPDPSILQPGDPELEWDEARGQLRIDPETCRTSHERVFAGGDLATGESGGGRTVTGAIAAGLRAAWGIDRALRGAEKADARLPPPRVGHLTPEGRAGVDRAARIGRQHPPELEEPVSQTGDHGEVSGALTEEQARVEAARCMICGLCGNCRSCIDLFGCPAFRMGEAGPEIDPVLCVACGVCAAFCPNGAIVPQARSNADWEGITP